MTRVKFREWDCVVDTSSKYSNDRQALCLVDAEDGSPICTASVNLPNEPCPEGHVFIKDWSENAGVLKALVEAGIVEDTGMRIPSGFVEAAMVRLIETTN